MEQPIYINSNTYNTAGGCGNSIEFTSQEKLNEFNMSGFSSNFSGPNQRFKGCNQSAVSPFSDDHQRPKISEKREILKLKQKIEERDACI